MMLTIAEPLRTLFPIILKVFEHIILSTCEKYLVTDELQFGFKRNVGCTDAIFAFTHNNHSF